MMKTEMMTRSGPVEGTKDKLAKDLRTVVDDADYLLQNVANSTAEEFTAARTRIVAKLSEARSRLEEARVAVTERAREATDATREYVVDNPWKVVGLAVAIGLMIGVLARRR
jgi:ElaB/YqjD/DUF883 family membrane-anchored ribosome-binding protein